MFLHKNVSVSKVYSAIQMRVVDCKQKHMLENGAPPDPFGALYHLLHIEFHGFNRRIDVLGLSHL